MTNTDLQARVKAFKRQDLSHEERRTALGAELGRAIFDRLTELYGKREQRSTSFESWLSQAFDTDGFPNIFETDQELVRLKDAVDRTQGHNGRPRIAKIVNEHLLGAGHEFGIGNYFVDVAPMTGRRLSYNWRGNPPAD